MRNVFLNGIRDRRGEVSDDDANLESATTSMTAPSSDDPAVEFFRTVLWADVEGALRALPLVFREAVILVDLEGFSYQEAAEALGCPIGTVMSRLSRARCLLRHRLRHVIDRETSQG